MTEWYSIAGFIFICAVIEMVIAHRKARSKEEEDSNGS